ncbi:MAG: DUF4445 domain-containing protein, partial [Candidatus Aminicenantes bacterium]|nr:DUF4445 domain-containing protein [Candidatus Aminicenantes bacterium]
MPHRVEILPPGRTVRVRDKTRLSDALRKAGLAPPAYCRRRGVCGQCFVEIVSGRLPAFRPGEQDLLERRGLSARHRLACLFLVESDLRLRIPESALPGRVSVVEFGPAFSLPLDPAVKKFAIRLPPSPTGEPCAEVDVLLEKLRMSRPAVPLEVLRKWPALLGRSEGLLTAVVSNEETLIDLEPGDTSERTLGLAFDVGTTTLAAALVDLSTGRVLSRDACLNGQAAYGADVIARINLVLEKPGRAETLRKTVLSDLTALAAGLMSSAGVEGETVYAASFAGNTVMSHLLLGLPVDTLAASPFSSLFSSLSGLSASATGIPFLHPRAPIYIAPVIRSFIGGDTSAGLAASGFLRQRAPALYLDLGTNGEAVLKTGRGLTAASAAAGPAFE